MLLFRDHRLYATWDKALEKVCVPQVYFCVILLHNFVYVFCCTVFTGAGDDKPEMLEGWVEKKGGGRVKMGSDWQRR